jgi:hypothetical protein
MTQERRYVNVALEAGQYAWLALNAGIDTLLKKEDPAVVIHEGLHHLVEARDALEAVLSALKGLERLHRVERLELRGEER